MRYHDKGPSARRYTCLRAVGSYAPRDGAARHVTGRVWEGLWRPARGWGRGRDGGCTAAKVKKRKPGSKERAKAKLRAAAAAATRGLLETAVKGERLRGEWHDLAG